MNKQKIDYKKAGVNIDEGNKLVDVIGAVVQATARPGADAKLGGFGSVFDLQKLHYRDPLLVSGTDGVGTKLKIASIMDNHSTIGQDLVAMCVNDIVAQGAEPLFFLDYFSTGKLKTEHAEKVIAGIAHGCTQAGCALIGGETAEMPGMYQPGEYDLAGFVVGIVEREHLLPQLTGIKPGDVVIGLASSGVHSNGYSLIRKIVETHNLLYDQPAPFDPKQTLGHALLEPTLIYSSAVVPLCKQKKIKAIAHITGGGLIENIPRVLPSNCGVTLDATAWPQQPVFEWIQKTAQLESHEMYRTFNCGIGMVLIVDQIDAQSVLEQITETELAYEIGTVTQAQSKQIALTNE